MLKKFELVGKSLEEFQGNRLEFTSKFYEILLTVHPELRRFFNNKDLLKQKKMLSGLLIIISRRWRQPETLASILRRIGGNHFRYGVKPEYFTIFEEVFLMTLEIQMGSNWTEEMQQAWSQAFDEMIEWMLEGYEEEKNQTRSAATFVLRHKFS